MLLQQHTLAPSEAHVVARVAELQAEHDQLEAAHRNFLAQLNSNKGRRPRQASTPPQQLKLVPVLPNPAQTPPPASGSVRLLRFCLDSC
jgi:hypothetical protein